jgi:HK97 family phage prohead protease
MTMKNKDFAFKVKLAADDPAGTIEGYVSVYGVRDSYNEVVMPGAFADSLARHKREGSYPLMLWQHDTYEPIGVWDDLSDDGKGLYAKGKLLIQQSVPCADKVYSLLKADAVRGMSIGYREIDVEPSTNGDPTKLVKLDILEASIVSFPANRRAAVEAVKSEAEECAIKSWKRVQDMARKFRDGEPLPAKEYEEILREAGFPKSVAVQIASVGYVKSIRSESGGEEANPAVASALAELRQRVDGFTIPKL